ncbi:MAG: serine/threonine-protein kinase [Polyangiaceae bacterium]
MSPHDLPTLELAMSSVPETVDPRSTISPAVIAKHTAAPTTARSATAEPERPRSKAPPEIASELAELPPLSIGGDSALLARISTPDASMPVAVPVAESAELCVRAVLGEGGMGIVYTAEQRSLGREVAMKVVKSTSRPRELAALLHEARLMGSLEHPGIIPVHALGTDAAGRPVLVMKRIEGTSWQDLLDDPAHPAWDALAPDPEDRLAAHLDILEQVTTTIAFAHSRGVLHRDIKPANVMIGSFGEVYVADWGIAMEMSERRVSGPIGTPAFLAPEMAIGDASAMDERTDVYLLGATLHFVLTNEPRHGGATVRDVLRAAAQSKPVEYPSTVPAALGALANRATSFSRDDRPATALEFRDGIGEYLKHRASLALSARASEALAEAVAAKASSDADHGARERSYLAQARFGFGEALREWHDNPDALAGLEKTFAAALEIELGDRSIRAARAILGEMKSPSDEAKARVAALEAELAAEEREREAARAHARDHDPTVARRNRTIFLAVLAAAGIGVTVGMRHSRLHGTGAPVPHTIVLPLLLALALSPIAFLLRADLGKSAVNRRFLAIIYIVFGASAALRGVAYLFQTHIEQMMTFELLLIATATATLGVTLHRIFFWVSAGAVLCAFLAQRFTNWLEIFYVPPFLGLIAMSTLVQKSAAPPPRT